MMRKLTITISEEVYLGLRAKIGPGRISRFIDSLARPHVLDTELDNAYKIMASDREREAQAMEWSENLTADAADETR
ncbi:MAG: addiction module antitoxin [Bryobacteraceae bacterium]